jgi:signal transduction histidine kinase
MSGMSLSISRQAIKSLGGSITISGSLEETTTCIVRLKLVSEKKNIPKITFYFLRTSGSL